MDYKNGKIYKIYSLKNPNKIYIGNTTNTLANRFSVHKAPHNTCLSKKIIDEYGSNTCVIELLQLAPCINKIELKMIEDMWIRCDRDYTIINNVNSPAKENLNFYTPLTKKQYKEHQKFIKQNEKQHTIDLYNEHLRVINNYENQKLRTTYHIKQNGEVKFILYWGHHDDKLAKTEFFKRYNKDKQLIHISQSQRQFKLS